MFRYTASKNVGNSLKGTNLCQSTLVQSSYCVIPKEHMSIPVANSSINGIIMHTVYLEGAVTGESE